MFLHFFEKSKAVQMNCLYFFISLTAFYNFELNFNAE